MRLCVDPGSVRVGLAVSDPSGVLASPLAVLARDERSGRDLDEIARLVQEREVREVLVGMPTGLRGRAGPAADAAAGFAAELARRVAPVPVRTVDERFSTVQAAGALRAAGRGAREGRSRIDAAAAAVVLQAALDQERRTGRPPGDRVPGAAVGDDE